MQLSHLPVKDLVAIGPDSEQARYAESHVVWLSR
jgi:hypothetical protein